MLCPQCLGGDDSPAEQKLPPPTEAQSPKNVERCVGNTVYDRQIESQMDGWRDGWIGRGIDKWIEQIEKEPANDANDGLGPSKHRCKSSKLLYSPLATGISPDFHGLTHFHGCS
jgi:hypothetical protein